MGNPFVKILTEYFSVKNDIILAILYGSYAKGNYSDKSDIDIAVAKNKVLTLDERLDLQFELSRLTQKEIDLVDIRTVKGPFHYKIFTEGKCIKIAENKGVKLLHKNNIKALYWYEDYYPIYSREQDRILKYVFCK